MMTSPSLSCSTTGPPSSSGVFKISVDSFRAPFALPKIISAPLISAVRRPTSKPRWQLAAHTGLARPPSRARLARLSFRSTIRNPLWLPVSAWVSRVAVSRQALHRPSRMIHESDALESLFQRKSPLPRLWTRGTSAMTSAQRCSSPLSAVGALPKCLLIDWRSAASSAVVH